VKIACERFSIVGRSWGILFLSLFNGIGSLLSFALSTPVLL
jgi:hypothetical protein